MLPSSRRRVALTLLLLVPILLWDVSGGDLPLARLFGTAQGFAWRHDPTFGFLLHAVPRALSTACVLALVWGVWRPWGPLRTLPAADRGQLVLSIVLAMLAVQALKRLAATSCPWDLAEFGGVAVYVSHWDWGVWDQGPGHCFPAGHASAAFGFVAGWWVLRRKLPRLALPWLCAALISGVVLGWAQQVRGAHYLSHTLWTGWICWSVGLLVEEAVQARRRLRAAGVTNLNGT
ncbi:phosphatase PAP2 family protein [Melaminivora alkalimesophila]|uniref:Membrane-associated PAP2 superfamily phosphatase n=1 Tax=Melaminivora alkalimesophila TaxID=1165852 RepID=A0A317RJ14_9BURK|nr:phosphatase PAP2 family protein [Melaminivora alkalimesophila]PWW49086.1 membrane-associated PAP2 superfamily phosphatase [Melaminivora alkalimesophila]